jgi:thiosulfate/3-mercaptopyruvate sulfurtransferase
MTSAATAPMTTNAPRTLVSLGELAHLQAGGTPVVLVDTSFDLADTEAGRRAWQAGHVPGAVYLHLDDDLSGRKTGTNGRHPLPERSAFAATLGRIGVTPQTAVIALDAQGGVYAARLWWLLRWMGHADAAVLDGGLGAWTRAGGTPTTEPPGIVPAPPYPERAPLVDPIDIAGLERTVGRTLVLDARAPERFRGETEPIDPVAGHIPGAANRFHRENLASGGTFKPAQMLRAEFERILGGRAPDALVHQCGSGVTACHNLLAMEHAGLAGSRLYPGSWSEWSADPSRPIARGG